MVEIDVQIAVEANAMPSPEDFVGWAQAGFEQSDRGELTIRVVSEGEIQQLNADFRQIDKSTNVLSFPADWECEAGVPYYGDIAICASVVEREAAEQKKVASAHWAHMVIHGVLHLRGYDHLQDAEAEEMEAKEVAMLAAFGIDNPYGCATTNQLTSEHSL